jgi:Fe-S-cluster containining protein
MPEPDANLSTGAIPSAAIPTEAFSAWLRGFRAAQGRRDGEGAAVPCGECRGCCTSAYFIPIAPDETDTLSRIPKALLFPAPGLPKGHRLLGYRGNGHCPMFIDDACSIYPQRPRACRRYDCRLFPATGTAVEEGKPRIAAQAARWRFAFPTDRDLREHAAVQAAARFLERHAEDFPPGMLPADPAQRALIALRAFEAFLDAGDTGNPAAGPFATAPEPARDAAAIRARIAAIADRAGLVPPGSAPAR